MEATIAYLLGKWLTRLFTSVIILPAGHVIQHNVSHDPQQGGLLDLPSVILNHMISYLTDPSDLLNFGLTHPLVDGMFKRILPYAYYRLF